MDRRLFVRGLMGLAAATVAVGAAGLSPAEAAPMPVAVPPAGGEAERVQSDYRPEVDGAPTTEKAQYYYYRRRRRFRPRRRVYYYRRPRRYYYRPRVYYRPRRVYYRRYRPVYYRRYW